MQAIHQFGAPPGVAVVNQRPGPADLGFGPLFWAARDAVIVCDVSRLEVLCCNPAVESIYGYTPDELEGQPLDVFIPDHLRSAIRKQSANYVTNIRSNPQEMDRILKAPVEMTAVHKTGRDLLIEFSVSPLDIPGEAFVFVIVRDITERKRLEAERNALLENIQDTLQRANELATLRADFAAMIAHEIGNPLAAINAMIDLVERGDLPVSKRDQLCSAIRTEVTLLQRLIHDFQDTVATRRDQFSSRLEPISLPCLLSDVTLSARSHLSDHDFRLETVPDVTVMADAGRISQVLGNLLGNAAKHTPPGTPVTLRARRDNDRVHIDVIDEGPGISNEDLEHIFTKFGRGRDATGQRLPGMGLGLYLSRGIVQDHGSTLFATSEPGHGTTFSFDLALAEAST